MTIRLTDVIYAEVATKKYTDAAKVFMDRSGYVPEINVDKISSMSINTNIARLGFVRIGSELVSQYDLQKGDEIEGLLFLREDAKIPEGVTIHGDLYIPGKRTLEAKDLQVDGFIVAPDLQRFSPNFPEEKFIITPDIAKKLVAKWQRSGSFEGHMPDEKKIYRSKEDVRRMARNYQEAIKIPMSVTLARRGLDR